VHVACPDAPILQLPPAQYAEQNALAQNTRSKKSSRKVSAHAANAGLERLPKELRAVGPLPDISKLLTAIVAEAWRLWIGLHPGSNPQAPLPPGTVGPEVPINPQVFGLTITAAATQDNQGFIVWQKDDSELLVVTGKVTVSLDDGLVLISLPVWCDQGTATLQVPFAVGGANSPAGMLVATEQHPRGPDQIILVWGEAVVAFAWQVLMSVLTRIASSTGKDQDGAGLIPAALTATADGVKILTMARHPFDRVTQ